MSAVRIFPQVLLVLRAGALLGLVALAGCAQPALRPAAPSSSLHAAHVAAISALRQWRLAGRLAVQREYKGFSADLDWREAASEYSLRVAAPLNGGTFALSGNDKAVTLVTPTGEIYTAADAETLLAQHLGWALPVAGTRYWLRGLPDPAQAVTSEHLDAAGRWTDFAQDGWRVSVVEYRAVAGLDLPRRLLFAHDKLQVRLLIKTWERR